MLGYHSYRTPQAPYGKKRRKNARVPVTMPWEVNYTCGHRAVIRYTVEQLGDAAEEVARLESGPCPGCTASASTKNGN